MINQEYNKKITEVLLLILEKLSETNINWILTGSTNLFIQGIEITAKDIDIVSTKEGIYKIEEIFKEYSIKKIAYSESEKYRSWFGRLRINNIQIDLMANLEYKPPNGIWIKSDSLNKSEQIKFKDYMLNVSSLENEFAFYSQMNRKNDANKKELIMKLKKASVKHLTNE